MLYYAGTYHGDDFMPGFAGRDWTSIAFIFLIAELATVGPMGSVIRWVAKLNGLFAACVGMLAFGVSCLLIYHGVSALRAPGLGNAPNRRYTYLKLGGDFRLGVGGTFYLSLPVGKSEAPSGFHIAGHELPHAASRDQTFERLLCSATRPTGYACNSADIVVQTGVSPATNSRPTDLQLYL